MISNESKIPQLWTAKLRYQQEDSSTSIGSKQQTKEKNLTTPKPPKKPKIFKKKNKDNPRIEQA